MGTHNASREIDGDDDEKRKKKWQITSWSGTNSICFSRSPSLMNCHGKSVYYSKCRQCNKNWGRIMFVASLSDYFALLRCNCGLLRRLPRRWILLSAAAPKHGMCTVYTRNERASGRLVLWLNKYMIMSMWHVWCRMSDDVFIFFPFPLPLLLSVPLYSFIVVFHWRIEWLVSLDLAVDWIGMNECVSATIATVDIAIIHTISLS